MPVETVRAPYVRTSVGRGDVIAPLPRITVFSSDLITEIPHPGACAPFRRGSPSLSAVLQAKDK